ncbi:MAG: rhomboid family intramembrane serine protease [Jaaginema sp. PMC 1079.18]|nr:rhomboid family intramembrane serine protease [Jaaginema sp. PMC 1080.18]MEC4851590.1 rhomboid family intramembrane serine protease [Jaaginema sp. PMC 1079.18]MEC4864839.1 rhomboid family intramembrane serine protease [Jaaginema sp. PMC 1078.18]
MSWTIWIVGLVCFFCISLSIRTFRRDRSGWEQLGGWPGISLGIAIVSGVLFWVWPQGSGIISLLLWGFGIILPIWGWQQLYEAIAQQHYDRALTWAKILPWLHRGDGWRHFPQTLRQLKQEISPRYLPRASRPLPPLSLSLLQYRLVARVYSREARWLDLHTWLTEVQSPLIWNDDPVLRLCSLRVLGEINKIEQLLWEIHHLETQRQFRGDRVFLNQARLLGFAFCGQTDNLEKTLQELKPFPQQKAQFWRLTAKISQGEDTIDDFLNLSDSASPELNNAITWRLSHPPQKCDRVLANPIAAQILQAIQSHLNEEKTYSNALRFSKRFAKATYALILCNSLVFSWQFFTLDSSHAANLLFWGALQPTACIQGQWWRIISANFLHINSLHLAANMLGLYLFGPFVEFSLGVWRYLGLYFLTGIGAMGLYTWISLQISEGDRFLMGASAIVMGLLGAIAAILLKGWLYEASALARRRLQSVIILVVCQSGFDLMIPQVSILAHLLGLGVGFAIALTLLAI